MSSDAVNLDEIFDYVTKLTKDCGEVFCQGYYGKPEIVEKDGHYWDLVTEYDGKIEDILINGITKKYPDHKFIAEETSSRTKVKPELTDDPTWIIDPIDGTTNFIHSFPHTAISIGMAYRKELVIGIVYCPVLNEFFSAKKGGGAFLNGKPIHSSKVTKLQNSLVGHEVSLASVPALREKNVKRLEAVVSKVQGIRSMGCAALGMAYVAKGSIDAYHIDDLFPWDMAAGVVLVREAGGIVMGPGGKEFDIMKPNVVAAGTEELYRALIELL